MGSVANEVEESVPEVPCSLPSHNAISGKHIKLHPMQADHAEQLFSNVAGSENDALYDYLPYGPFHDLNTFCEHISTLAASTDTQFYAIQDIATGKLVGQISHLRIVPEHRVIEIGHVLYGPSLQKSVAATEAFYLMANKAFEEGYRRLEWKCNASNAGSKRAALRLGHVFEGIFRQHMIVKGKNRDSAWFSILDREWPARKEALERWMNESNFDENGRQRRDLLAFQREVAGERGEVDAPA